MNVVHHLFDIVSVNDDFSVYEYQKIGRNLIDKLLKENKNIIIVGGTGLYLKALLYDYTFDDNTNKDKVIYPHKIIGLTRNRDVLYDNINKRVDIMLQDGLLNEVKELYDKNIKTRAVMMAIGYKELYEYYDGIISLEDAIEKIKHNSRHYAKRQYTFFNNQFANINWYNIDCISFDNIIEDIINK